MNVKILKDIKIYDELIIISHPRKIRGASFPRDFIIKVGSETVAVARSMWVLLDLEKRTILRPSALDDIGSLPPSEDDLFEISDIRRVIDENSLSRTDVLRVEYSHLDMNNHLNNTYYSDFIFNIIDKNIHESDEGIYIQINYKNEARHNDILSVHSGSSDDGTCFDFSAINDANGKACFTAYVSFGRD